MKWWEVMVATLFDITGLYTYNQLTKNSKKIKLGSTEDDQKAFKKDCDQAWDNLGWKFKNPHQN